MYVNGHDDLEITALELFQKYRNGLFAVALRLCGDHGEAEDLVMRTFDSALRNAKNFDAKKGDVYAWMSGILVHLYNRTRLRAVNRGTQPAPLEMMEMLSGGDNGTLEQILRNSDHEALRMAIDQLDDEYKQALSLYYLNELSLKEVATLLGTSVSTISRRLQVAERILASKLKTRLGKRSAVALIGAACLVVTLFGAWTAGMFKNNEMTLSDGARACQVDEACGDANGSRMLEAAVRSVDSVNGDLATEQQEDRPGVNEMKMTTMRSAIGAVAVLCATSASQANATAQGLPVADGLVLHLDATDLGSLNRDKDDFVRSWQNLADPEDAFTTNTTWHQSHPKGTPYYDATAFGNRGGVRFGWVRPTATADGEYSATGLMSTQNLLKNLTIFIVCRPDADANADNCPYFGKDRNYVLSRVMNNTEDSSILTDKDGMWRCDAANAKHGNTFWINGKCCLDGSIAMTNATIVYHAASKVNRVYEPSLPGETQVLGLRNDQSYANVAVSALWNVDKYGHTKFFIGRCGCAGSPNCNYMFAGWIGEIVTYDRVLDDIEFLKVQSYLINKWGAEKNLVRNYIWTGAKGTSEWNADGNWDQPGYPTSGDSVVSIGDSAVDVNGSAGCLRLLFTEGGKVNLSNGAHIEIKKGMSITLPAGSAISGTVTKDGYGTISLADGTCDFSDATLKIKNGFFDVKGGNYVFGKLMAENGLIVNSAPETGTVCVSVGKGESSEIGAYAVGDINMVKSGQGDVTFTTFSGHRGETRLAAGNATLGGEDHFPGIPGVVIHLDASDVRSVFTNDEGCVWKWSDTAGNGKCFVTNASNHSYNNRGCVYTVPQSLPTFEQEAFGGKGGVRFGWYADGDANHPNGCFTQQFLTCSGGMPTNLTVVAVVMLDGRASGDKTSPYYCPCYEENYSGMFLARYRNSGTHSEVGTMKSNGESWWLNPPYNTGKNDLSFWRNGKCYIDRPRGYVAEGVKLWSSTYYAEETGTKDVAQVVVFRSSQTNYIDEAHSLYIDSATAPMILGRHGADGPGAVGYMFSGWLGELITYDHALTDSEIQRIQSSLMRKWNITDLAVDEPNVNNQLSRETTLCLERGATLTLNGTTQEVAALEFGGGSSSGASVVREGSVVAPLIRAKTDVGGRLPELDVEDSWDLSDITLEFDAAGKKPKGGVLMRTTGLFTGEFSEVKGNRNQKVQYLPQSVQLQTPGFMLILRGGNSDKPENPPSAPEEPPSAPEEPPSAPEEPPSAPEDPPSAPDDSPSAQPTNGILCLTFDDPNWENWEAALPLFAQYGARASFFPHGALNATALASLKRIHDAGHAVGPHTLHHVNAVTYVAEHGLEAFWESEVKPQLDALATVGIQSKVMAYVDNVHNDELDAYLSAKGLTRFRCGADGTDWGPNRFGKKHAAAESAYSPAADFSTLKVAKGIGVGSYYKTDIADLLTAIDRIAANNECLVLYSHAILPESPGNVDMPTDWLRQILSHAAALGVQFRTLED